MPRRKTPDPLAAAVGGRIRQLREERAMTMEQLAYEGDMSKGFLSDIEHGLARPTVAALARIAVTLDVLVFDLLVFPADDERQQLTDVLRRADPEQLQRVRRALSGED
jgi:transcriptional regulator with XRE-family HTH domain